MHVDVQKILDAAFAYAVESYLGACKDAQALKRDDPEQDRLRDRIADERNSGVEGLLGVLLDILGYDVRMEAPNPGGEAPASFIQWTKVEREIIRWGYDKGLIERDHMLAWFDHNQTNGWLRDDKQPIPA